MEVLYSASFGTPYSAYEQAQSYDGAVMPYAGAKSSNPGTDRENNISIDYTHPVTEHLSIETGLKTVLQSIYISADVNTYRPQTDNYLPDPGQTYHINYNMQVYAGYISASFLLFDLLKVKTGARYEYTDIKIDFPNTVIPAYDIVVPSVVFSHDLNKTAFIKLSYTRRIERPDYRDVNPFINRADPYNFTMGNPLLKPEIGNNCELGFNKTFGKGSYIYVSLVERINTQDHKSFTEYYQSYTIGDSVYSNVAVTTTKNTGTEYNSGASRSGSWTIKDKLSLRSNVSLTHRYLATSIGSGDINAGFRFRANLNVSYQFPHNLVGEVFGNYNSATNNIQGRSPQSASYTMAFRKQFWDKNASIGITATNLFNQYIRQVTTIETPSYSSYSVRELPYRSVGISFTYKFGKLEFKKGKDDNGLQNEPPAM